MQEQEQAPDVATRFRLAIVEEARDAIESAWSVLKGAARRLAESPAAGPRLDREARLASLQSWAIHLADQLVAADVFTVIPALVVGPTGGELVFWAVKYAEASEDRRRVALVRLVEAARRHSGCGGEAEVKGEFR